jgi:hypothetical protein
MAAAMHRTTVGIHRPFRIEIAGFGPLVAAGEVIGERPDGAPRRPVPCRSPPRPGCSWFVTRRDGSPCAVTGDGRLAVWPVAVDTLLRMEQVRRPRPAEIAPRHVLPVRRLVWSRDRPRTSCAEPRSVPIRPDRIGIGLLASGQNRFRIHASRRIAARSPSRSSQPASGPVRRPPAIGANAAAAPGGGVRRVASPPRVASTLSAISCGTAANEPASPPGRCCPGRVTHALAPGLEQLRPIASPPDHEPGHQPRAHA